MSYFLRAIETVGRPTLFIKGKEVLCHVRVNSMRGDEIASIGFSAEDYQKYIKPLYPNPGEGFPAHKLFTVRFMPSTGLFLETNIGDTEPEKEAIEAWFSDTAIVDEQNFKLGMVWNRFEEVPGFNTYFAEVDRITK